MAILSIFLLSFTLLLGNANAKSLACSHVFNIQSQKAISDETIYNLLEKVPNSKGNVLLIHGLGDSLAQLQKLSDTFKKDGYSVLRVDLHGHGKNLEKLIADNKNIPNLLPYHNNVRDVLAVIKKHNFKNPIIVGHSYGGAIAHAVSNQLKGDFAPRGLIMMAPYLRRLDYAYLTGNPIIDMQTEYMSEQFMRQSYREYFESQKRENIDEQVEAAIATTKGIRSFDVLGYDKKASLETAVPLLIIAGTKDELVKEDQIQDFHKKLLKESYSHEVIFIEGDHFFPHKEFIKTSKMIRDFIQKNF